jgi:hypothetical protein
MTPRFWLMLFTHKTWQEFLAAGASVAGFRENRWKTVESMRPGDLVLCYLTGVSRWIGLLEVTGPAFQDVAQIWSDAEFSARVRVKVLTKLDAATAVPVIEMRDRLTIFQDLKSPHAWTGHFRGSPAKFNPQDGTAVVEAIQDAARHPVERPFDQAKLNKTPPILKTSTAGAVTVPEDDTLEATMEVHEQAPSVVIHPVLAEAAPTAEAAPPVSRAHTEVQWLLLKLGNDMGLDVWVARNDKSQAFGDQPFSSLPGLKKALPLQFDEATTRTIELIDVLWLKGNSIQAAFEIESTTSIYSGLLRMSDLITMQPNLTIPLYIVAPSERRDKVVQEINRPTFARLKRPMSEMCRFISFEELRRSVASAANFVRFLKPEFLEGVSESCEPEAV